MKICFDDTTFAAYARTQSRNGGGFHLFASLPCTVCDYPWLLSMSIAKGGLVELLMLSSCVFKMHSCFKEESSIAKESIMR